MTKLITFLCCFLLILTSIAYLGIANSEDSSTEYDNLKLIIDLKAARFDPLLEAPDIPIALTYSDENNYYLVQCRGVIQPGWVEEIQDIGAVILGYVPEYTYILYMGHDAKKSIEKLPFIRWVGAYHPAYKIEESLLSKQGTVKLNVMVFDSNDDLENFKLVEEKIIGFGGKIIREEMDVNTIVAEIDAVKIGDIAFIPEVEWIDEYFEPEALMDNIRVFTGADNPLHEHGFNGTGIVGEVKDNGIDQDHVEFEGNLIGTDGNIDESSHGSSTFGIVFAKGVNERAEGMLPGAKGVFASWGVGRKQSIANLVNNWDGVFQSNSWSSGSMDGSYGSNSRQNDDAIFEYDVSMLYATGNGGADESISQEAASKNVISVGATNHYNNQDRTDDRHNGNQGNKGPTADGRFKPDVVGPYDSIYTTSSSNRYTSGFGGTSGATPVVAGGVGLIYEMYRENHFKNNPSGKLPHAASVKALLIADAYQYEFTQADRYAQGWGLVDVGNVFDIGKNHLIDDDNNALRTGDSQTYTIAPTTATPLKITLVWTDVPGTTSTSKHLINDLNLKVTDPDGKIYYGNNGLETAKWSASGGGFDDLNNVENVFIENPASGEWIIDVIGENIPMDGYPITREADQSYALVASGVTRNEHDLKVQSIEFPKLVGFNEETSVTAKITNIGTHNEADIQINFLVDNNTLNTTIIESINVGDTAEVKFTWTPADEKQYLITVFAEPLNGETSIWDNEMNAIIIANKIAGRVLVDDGHGTDTNHDLYYNYLETLGSERYRVHHTAQSITTKLLGSYDVFISATPTQSYTSVEVTSIENFVNSGGGILVIGEADRGIYSELTSYAGIDWGNPFIIQYDGETNEINSHEITENISSLYFNSPQVPLTVNTPAEEIVYTYGGVLYNRVTVAAAQHGQGKIVAIADTDCLNSGYFNVADNTIFGENIIKWLTNARPYSIIDSPQNNSKYLITDTIQFDGQSSYDPDGDVLTYQWRSDIDDVIGNSAAFKTSLTFGLHKITLQVSDSGGKIGEAGITLRVLTPPTVEIQYPGDGALLNNAVEVSGTTSDPDGALKGVFVQLDDRNWQEATDTSTIKDWSKWTLSLDTTIVSDGSHKISVRSRDDDGLNSSIKTITVVIDNTPPGIIDGPEVYSINDTGASIKWETDEPSSGIVEYGTKSGYGYYESDESVDTQHIIILTGLLPETTYHFKVVSVDVAGNNPAMSTDRTFETLLPPDFTPPIAIITSPLINAILDGEVQIKTDISDNRGIAKVEFYIDGNLEYTDDTPDYYWSWDTTEGYYPDGEYSIKILAADLSGNEASDEITVTLDNEIIPPSIDLTGAVPDSIKHGEIVKVLFTAKVIDPEGRLEYISIDLSPIDGSSSQTMFDDGTHGDQNSGDNKYSIEAVVSSEIPHGIKTLIISITYGQGETFEVPVTLHIIPQNQDGDADTGLFDEQVPRFFWWIVIGIVVIVIIAFISLTVIDKRRRLKDAIEVEPLDN
jgi:5'(3')-deoxyribonucleotidase